jgi:hypothetical protein
MDGNRDRGWGAFNLSHTHFGWTILTVARARIAPVGNKCTHGLGWPGEAGSRSVGRATGAEAAQQTRPTYPRSCFITLQEAVLAWQLGAAAEDTRDH